MNSMLVICAMVMAMTATFAMGYVAYTLSAITKRLHNIRREMESMQWNACENSIQNTVVEEDDEGEDREDDKQNYDDYDQSIDELNIMWYKSGGRIMDVSNLDELMEKFNAMWKQMNGEN